jgi:TolB-like protein
MKMKKIIIFVTLILMATLAFTQQKMVAVSTFANGRGVSVESANTITNLVIGRLADNSMVRVVDRASFDKILAEMKFQQSDWSNSEKTAALGKATNADYIIRGEIDILDDLIIVTARMIDILTAKVVASSDIDMERMNQARSKMPEFVDRFNKTLGGDGDNNTGDYTIGDIGPAGGIVFYDRGVFSDNWRYLEAAPAETEFTAQWGAYEILVGRTETALGTGKGNTQIIVERLRRLGETKKAAQLCTALDFNGYRDWFLPSKDELDLMYKNLKAKSLDSFGNGWYWSSSEGNGNIAWGQYFSVGSQGSYTKGNAGSVRAIRAF